MRILLASTFLICGLAFACQTQPSQKEKDLQAQIASLEAERAGMDYLGELKAAVEGWRKAMNGALGKYSAELAATRLESQQQVTTMAGSLDAMARALVEQKQHLQQYLAEFEKDQVQASKTLEEIKLERSAARIEREGARLERERVTALLDTIQRGRVQDAADKKVQIARLDKLDKASGEQLDRQFSILKRQGSGLEDMDRGLLMISKKLDELEKVNAESRDPEARVRLEGKIEDLKKALVAEQKTSALEREQGRQDRQDLELRLDALAAVVERSFAGLDKQMQKAELAQEEEAAAIRRLAQKVTEQSKEQTREQAAKKSALPGPDVRDPGHLMSETQPFWENPFIAIPGAFLLLVLLFFLLRRSPEEAGMDQREAPERQEREALEAVNEPESPPRSRMEKTGTPVVDAREKRRMPAPKQPGAGAETEGRPTVQNAMPRPRCVSLRIPGDELTEGAEELLRERLGRDPRILVEPRPRLERRGDGSLSARFYSVGGLAETEVEALSRSLRSLVANR